MTTLLETLKRGVSNYPVPMATLERVALVRGVNLDDEATVEIVLTKAYRLADADVKLWVSIAPNVSQGGITFDLPAAAREAMKTQANAVYKELGDSSYEPGGGHVYGYKGGKL